MAIDDDGAAFDLDAELLQPEPLDVTTPTAEMTRSTSSVWVLPLPSSMVATTLSLFLSSLVTLVPVRILMPCLSKLLRANAETSASSTGSI
jgi:hypothetical protein